jgi:hypothetical protein
MGNDNHVVSHKLCGFQGRVAGHVMMKEPVVAQKFLSFSTYIFSQNVTDTKCSCPTPYHYFFTVKCFQMQFMNISFTTLPHVLFIHIATQFKVSI